MTTARIGIVGMGPRGLTILERIVAHERVRKSADIQIFIFDPKQPGVGTHDPEQSDFMLVNTVSGQITQFSDTSVTGAGPILEGPSFHQWLEEQSASTLLRLRESDRPVSPDAYYGRGLFGRYLHWVYHYLVALAPTHVKIHFVREAVMQADRISDEDWLVVTPTASYGVNYLFLTTGHSKTRGESVADGQPLVHDPAKTTVVGNPYPVERKLAGVDARMTVAIEGLGLTTFDVLAQLTVGRGGRFEDLPNGRKQYVASGQEPRLIAYSRSGLPLTARAVNQKGVSIQYKARFLRADTVRAMRATRKLDFLEDVFPLLLADMQYAYYEAYFSKQRRDPVTAMLFCNQFVCADAEQRQALIEQYVPEGERFCWERLVDPIPESALASPRDFHEWLMGHLRADLAEAKRGNVDSPLKAACDVVRDVRDNLRVAIDFGGLTEASHRWLMSEFVPIMNRIAVGPPSQRIAELLALVDAGVLDLSFGPGVVCSPAADGGRMRVASTRWPERSTPVDVLVKARVSMPSPQEDASPLMRSLLDAGLVRPFANGGFQPGGIEVDRDFRWVTADGESVPNAWALGIPTEGVKFYTFVVPRSGVNSTAIVDAGRTVIQMLSMITGDTTARPEPEFIVDPVPTTEYASAFASLYGAL
jgi:uncharacterized NAD(P)/FAD-binding protein YdhS